MRALLVLSLLVAAACAPAGPPVRDPDIVGVITRISNSGSTILVEQDPNDPAAGAKASVAIDASTRVWNVATPGGVSKIPASDLRSGVRVRVWFDGPVAMSYPVQGRAADVSIGD